MIIKNKYTLKDFEKELTKIGEKILYWQKNPVRQIHYRSSADRILNNKLECYLFATHYS